MNENVRSILCLVIKKSDMILHPSLILKNGKILQLEILCFTYMS
jgi:hypothetical protein